MPTIFEALGIDDTPAATPPPPPAKRTVLGTAKDIGLSAVEGAMSLPEAAVGLADIVTGGAAGSAAEKVGFRPREAREILNTGYSDAQKAANRNFDEADGILDKAIAAMQNPSVIGHAVVKSVPSMLGGAAVARGALAVAPKLSPVVAAAGGEGVVGAGSAAEGIRQDTTDGRLSGEQAGLAAASGVATGGLALLGGKVARSLGIHDVDTLLAGVQRNPRAAPGVVRRVLEGVLTEGVIEELPQSISEQVIQNKALGRPLDEGVDSAAVLGLLSGGAMGAGVNLMHRSAPAVAAQAPQAKPLALGMNPDPMVSFPDGTTGRRSEIEAYIKTLPEREQMAMRARMQGLAPQPADETSPGAGAAAPRASTAAEPEAPMWSTEPGAGQDRAGIEFQREVDTSGLSLAPTRKPHAQAMREIEERHAPQRAIIEQLEAAGDTAGAKRMSEVLKRTVAADTADYELAALQQDVRDAAKPMFQQTYKDHRTEGKSASEAAARAAMIQRFADLAGAADLSEKAIGAGLKAVGAMKSDDQAIAFLDKYAAELRKAGLGSLGTIKGELAAVSERAIASVARELYARAAHEETTDGVLAQLADQLQLELDTPRPPTNEAAAIAAAIDASAHAAATSPLNDLREPTEAEKKAGNYQKGHLSLHGLDIAVENPRGSTRSGTAPDGSTWKNTMDAHYGYIKGSVGADKDHVDVFIGPNPESRKVYVVDQVNPDGSFDEHKALLGWTDIDSARAGYMANYSPGWTGLGAITEMPLPAFKAWVKSKHAKEPLSDEVAPAKATKAEKPEATSPAPPAAADQGAAPSGEGAGLDAGGGAAGPGAGGQPAAVAKRPANGDNASDGAELQSASDRGADRAQRSVAAPGADGRVRNEADVVGPAPDAVEKRGITRPANPVAQTPADAGVSAFKWEKRASGTLMVKGDRTAILEKLKSIPRKSLMIADGGVMVGVTQADRALAILEGKPAPKPAQPLRVGTTPATAELVTVRDGVVYIGEDPALDYDSAEPITVPEGATEAQIKQALKDGGALTTRQKFFGSTQPDSSAKRTEFDFTAPGQLSVEEVESAAREIVGRWDNPPKLHVVQSYRDLPGKQYPDTRGLRTDGAVWIVAPLNRSREQLAKTLAHEAIAHHGLRDMLGKDDWERLMANIQAGVKRGDKALVKLRDSVRAVYLDEAGNPYLTPGKEADEITALAVEQAVGPDGRFRPGLEFLKAVYARIAQFLRDIGINIPFTHSQLQGMLLLAQRNLEVGKRTQGGGELAVAAARAPGWDAAVDQAIKEATEGKDHGRGYVEVGTPSPQLLRSGIPDRPLRTSAAIISKAHFEHGVPKSALKELPELLDSPFLVFKSDTVAGSYVVVTSKVIGDRPLIVAIKPDVARGGDAFNFIPTLLPKDDFRVMQRWIDDGLLLLRDGKQNPQWFGSFRAPVARGSRPTGGSGSIVQPSEAGDKLSHGPKDAAESPPQAGDAVPGESDSAGNGRPEGGDAAGRSVGEGPAGEAGAPDESAAARGPSLDAGLTAATVTELTHRTGNKLTDYRGVGLQLLGRRQLVDIYHDLLPQLPKYSELVQRMDADKNERGAEADTLARDWAKLPDERALAELMHDATLAQIDASKPHVAGDDEGKWRELNARYRALSEGAKATYAAARDTYTQHRKDVREALKQRIERSEIQGPRKAELLKRMDAEFFGHVKGVYFPLARFGQYVIVTKNAAGQVENVSRAETMTEAEAALRQLRMVYPASKGFTVGKIVKSKDFNAGRDAVGRGFMTQLYEVLGEKVADANERAELEDALGQLYLSSLPDVSWAKHGIHRKGTPGFSQDARRAFAQNVFHGARYLAKLRYSDLLVSELTAMQKHVEARAGDEKYDSVKAQQVVDEMVKRHDEQIMNPKVHPLSTALTSAGFVFYLGMSPASAIVNLSQTAMVAYPVMGAKWGFGKAADALARASNQAIRGKNDISKALSADEKRAYDEAVRSGVIDVTQAHDLAGIAQGEDSKVIWKLRPAMRWASFLFHHAEKFNRMVTFVASYRLARQAGASHAKAYEDAVDATFSGHFDYSASNRPRVMQGNVAKVVLLFKQYAQNMIYLLSRQAYLAVKAAKPEERAEARKALAGILTAHAMAAGALGLPVVGTLLAAASWLGGSDDEPWDAKVALQNYLAEAFGQKPAEVMVHGLSRLTPWDVSGRLGLDKLIFPDIREGLEGQSLYEAAAGAAIGPVGGIIGGALKGLQEMSEGRYARGLEEMVPTAVRNPLKAVRYGTEGALDRTGVEIVEEVSPAAVLGQALGFSPSEVRNATEGKGAIINLDRRLNERRKALLQMHTQAFMTGDQEGIADAKEDIDHFNEVQPDRKITPVQMRRSIENRRKRIENAQQGVTLPKSRQGALEAGKFAVADAD